MPTFSEDSLLAVRFHNARPGLELIAIIDAGLPVAKISAEVDAQDRKGLPLLDEYVLRLVDHQVPTLTAIGGYLGLPEPMVTACVADHFSNDYLRYGPAHPTSPDTEPSLQLTARGRTMAQELTANRPVRVTLPLVWDQLLWKVRPYDTHTLRSPDEADEAGLLALPTTGRDPVQVGDLPAAEINALLQARADNRREVLEVRRVTQHPARKLAPAKVLVYADAARTDIQLGVVVDGELSTSHELALLNHGGHQALGIRVDPPQPRPELAPDLEAARVPLDHVTATRAQAAAVQLGEGPRPVAPPTPEPAEDEVRAISVFEHPDLLDEALSQAVRRLLVISPWIKNAIITTDFLSKLESRLRRSVSVHIAYGYKHGDDSSDHDAVRRLANLAARYENFTLTELRSNHAKVLIFDDVWVSTSFNWLSFKGDRDRTYRMEEGTLVRGRTTADAQYQRFLDQIDQARV